MRILYSTLLLSFLGAHHLSAQVTVEVSLDQEQYLPSETLAVIVRVINYSGQTLELGEDQDWLRFAVEARDGFIVSRNAEPPVTGAFTLGSSRMATKRVDISPYFQLTRPGRYTVNATVNIKEWGRQYEGKPVSFDIITGTTLWEKEFGVPQEPGETGEPEVRKYILQQANYQKELRLYVRVTDASETRTYRVLSLGKLISFSHPEAQVDKQSNLHVLYQDGARTFNYSVVNPEGELVVRQTHDYANSRPRLLVNTNGQYQVAGGLRRVTADDLPKTEKPALSDDAKKP